MGFWLAMVVVVAAILAIGAATRPQTREGDWRVRIFVITIVVAAVGSLILICGGGS